MEERQTTKYQYVLAGLAILVGLYWTSLYNYLLFHSLAELFGIVVVCGMFMFVWNARRFIDNSYLLLIGIAYLFIGGLDLLHTLAYKGMGVFPDYDADLPTQLWIMARYLESLTLLGAPFLIGRRLEPFPVFIAYSGVLALLLSSVFVWDLFPTCFVEGVGLTSFKVTSEYIISVVLVLAMVMLLRKRDAFELNILRLLTASIMLTIVSELLFTFYVHVYGISNLIGHYFKIISFFLVYKALIETGFRKPYALLFRDLKSSEEALKKERDFAAAVLNTTGALVAVLDREGKIIRFNRACQQLSGYDFRQVKGRRFWDVFLVPEEVEGVKEIFSGLAAGADTHEQENCWITKTGKRRSIISSYSGLFSETGRMEHMIVSGIDITERKKAEEEFNKLFLAVEQSPVSVVITNAAGTIEYVNPKFQSLTGYTADEAVGENPNILKSGEHTPGFYRDLWDTITQGREWRGEFYNRKKSGHFYWESARISPVSNEEGIVTHYMAIKEDVTDRKRMEEELLKARDDLERRVEERTAELLRANQRLAREIEKHKATQQALQQSQHLYSTVVEGSLTGVYIEQDGKIKFANERFSEIYKYPRDEVAELDIRKLVHPEDMEMVTAVRNRRLQGEDAPMEYSARGLTKRGETIWVTRRNSVISYQGRPAILGNVVDITKRKQMEKDLRLLSSRLLTAEENERKRIAQELHDGIGQLLGAIKFRIESLVNQNQGQFPDGTQKGLDAVVPLIQQTMEETRRILMDLRPSILDDLGVIPTISWFCREYQNIYQDVAVDQRIDIDEADIPDFLKTVIYRLLQEALNNIAKHSRADRAQIHLRRKANRIQFQIKDNGVGFDLSEKTAGDHFEGGIGLAGMRERAELSGGDFMMQSSPGEGTQIRASWPMEGVSL